MMFENLPFGKTSTIRSISIQIALTCLSWASPPSDLMPLSKLRMMPGCSIATILRPDTPSTSAMLSAMTCRRRVAQDQTVMSKGEVNVVLLAHHVRLLRL